MLHELDKPLNNFALPLLLAKRNKRKKYKNFCFSALLLTLMSREVWERIRSNTLSK